MDDDVKLLASLTLQLYGGDKELAKAELKRCLGPLTLVLCHS